MLLAALLLIAVVLILASVLTVSDNLIQIEAKQHGIDTEKNNLSIFPSLGNLVGKPAPDFADKKAYHNLSKGHDIKLAGKATNTTDSVSVSRFALKPTDYRGIAPIPKMEVAVGDEVKAGEPIFFDKQSPDIKYVAPVSGELVELRRGAKRAVTHIVILADKEQQYHQNEVINLSSSKREELVTYLMASGGWTLMNQRPFDIVPDPAITPDNIFISAFSTAPLAPDYSHLVEGRANDLQSAIDVLNALTSGKVYIGLDGRGVTPNAALTGITGAEKHYFNGKHPAGNVGVQIHHVAPIKNTGAVWTLTLENALTLGHLVRTGKYNSSKIVALTGAQFETPQLVKTFAGASIDELTKGNIKSVGTTRLIEGDVLSGKTLGTDDFLGNGVSQITSIKEGDDYELFGWLLPVKPRPSISKSMPGFLMPGMEYEANTNTHGEKRAFVVTGQYEKMMPMDILPQHLMKAIMAGDIERMEGLGINELSEEDVALAEFACTSKMPLQEILRDGLDMMREQA